MQAVVGSLRKTSPSQSRVNCNLGELKVEDSRDVASFGPRVAGSPPRELSRPEQLIPDRASQPNVAWVHFGYGAFCLVNITTNTIIPQTINWHVCRDYLTIISSGA